METLYIYGWYFVIYAVLGWCAEVCFCTVNTGKIVNRGFLNGPVCPIYGFGMVIVAAVLTPLSGSLAALFVGGALLTSALEFAGGWALKKLFHTSWWDYSDLPFNLGGYICLKFSLLWGVAVTAVMRVLQPGVAALVKGIPRPAGYIILAAVACVFLCDLIVTVNGVARLNRDLGRIADLARLLHAGSDKLAEELGGAALAAGDAVAETKLNVSARLDVARAETLDKRNAVAERLMKAFPDMRPMEPEALAQMKEWLHEANAALKKNGGK